MTTIETVTELTPDMTGIWRVTTRDSVHVWNLDNFTWTRQPGVTAPRFPYDAVPLRIWRVHRYPKVGEQAYAEVDDPTDPENTALWRISSVVLKIERVD